MNRQVYKILLMMGAILLSSCKTVKPVPENGPENVPAENLIIYYEPEAGNEALLAAAKKYGSQVLYVYKVINGIAVTVPKGKTSREAMEYYGRIPGVLSVTQDRKLQLD